MEKQEKAQENKQEYEQEKKIKGSGFVRTKMTDRYFWKLLFRVTVFVLFFIAYIVDKDGLYQLMKQPIQLGITPLHILWFGFMVIMISHLFPSKLISMARRKAEKEPFQPVEGYSKLELLEFVQDQNVKAWKVMLVWLFGNGVIGLLYLLKVFTEIDLLMFTVFFFLCDYICILFYCPFQSHIMKNRCCINCRIYDWGHFMMFTPMLFIRNFYSWSLFFTSCVVLIHWEIMYAKHPERFWSKSNKTLQCANCKDKTCQVKRRITGGVKNPVN